MQNTTYWVGSHIVDVKKTASLCLSVGALLWESYSETSATVLLKS
jgi:hypothetical protein